LKKICFATLLFVCVNVFSQIATPSWVKNVGAKSFPSSTRILFANDFGAISDTSTVNTKSIQAAIGQCASLGGGVVRLFPGVYVTGSLFIRSNVQERIDKDVLILGSQNFNDYPEIQTRVAGIETTWPAALMNFIGVKNAAITGNGVINARGKFCWDM